MSDGQVLDGPEATELAVTFQPHLYEQRRAWVLDVLRREQVTAVLDVGCGEGETIGCLCNPAPWRSPYSSATTLREDIVARIMRDDFLHLRSVFALDVSSQALKDAVSITTPPRQSQPGQWHGYTRWEALEVKIWEGGLESYNAEFVNIDCIICTEVIEHLSEDILPEFAPMLLGVYHPRLLLVTTPSYTFNARFTAPDAPPGTRQGYRDPTARTSRIFRHDDHKFEWTVQEFTEWCQNVAEAWGYDVEVSGVGKAREKDQWGRDDELGFASQVAAFKRKEGEAWMSMRDAKTESSGIWKRTAARQHQRIVATHLHEAHESAGRTGTLEQIGQRVRSKIENWDVPKATIHELWFEPDLSAECGGCLSDLIVAAETHEDLKLLRASSRPLDWIVEWPGFSEKEQPECQEQEKEEADLVQSMWNNESGAWGHTWGQEPYSDVMQSVWDGQITGWGDNRFNEEVTGDTGRSWGSDKLTNFERDTALERWGQSFVTVTDWSQESV